MENEWKMLLWLWNIIPLSPDNNPVLIARMLHKTWITRLVLGQWVDLNYPLDISSLFSVGPKQKTTAKKIRRGKDGRVIAPRKAASAGRNIKEQKWKAEDMDLVFDLWERNKTLPPEKRLSKNQIHKQTGVPYTTVCERLSGRRGGGKRGKIAGGKRTPKVLEQGTSG